MARAAVIGTTSWGTTLAVLMARNGGAVRLLARRRSEAEEIERLRENRRFVPGVELPEGVSVTESPAEAMDGAGIVVVAVPSRSIRTNLSVLSAHLPAGATLVSATKGLEVSSGKRMTEVMAEEIGTGADGQICALSGPNLAAEVDIRAAVHNRRCRTSRGCRLGPGGAFVSELQGIHEQRRRGR